MNNTNKQSTNKLLISYLSLIIIIIALVWISSNCSSNCTDLYCAEQSNISTAEQPNICGKNEPTFKCIEYEGYDIEIPSHKECKIYTIYKMGQDYKISLIDLYQFSKDKKDSNKINGYEHFILQDIYRNNGSYRQLPIYDQAYLFEWLKDSMYGTYNGSMHDEPIIKEVKEVCSTISDEPIIHPRCIQTQIDGCLSYIQDVYRINSTMDW